jgi:kynurenine formamidase
MDRRQRTLLTRSAVAGAIVAGAVMIPALRAAERRTPVTKAQLESWKKELSNWGRWGKDDQIGALNLITPAKRKEAAALVRDGVSVSLARDAEVEKAVDNPQPYEHVMLGIGGDKIGVAMHGTAHTHFDSLAHVSDAGKFYNGYTPTEAEVMKANGHAKNSVYNVKNGVFTRGVLMDIPRLKGVPYLEPGTPIYVEDLEAWEKQAGMKVGPGDALFVRTGRWARRAEKGPWLVMRTGQAAGLDPSVIPWLRKRDIAVMGSDSSSLVAPMPPEVLGNPHDFVLTYLGMHLFDSCDLEALAKEAAARHRWEFLLTAAPLPIRGGTGSPINPIAMF